MILWKAFNTSCAFFPQLLVNFDTAVHSGSWSTSLPESLEVCANWRERAWPLTSAHWLRATTVCPTVLVHVWLCMCVLYTNQLYTILFITLHPSHRKCVLLEMFMYFSSHTVPLRTTAHQQQRLIDKMKGYKSKNRSQFNRKESLYNNFSHNLWSTV